jgi:5,10-methylene-tetrahydrofolate dehydrogenase/methenyl tetrahydrofolate cyclohydrolase
MELLLGKETALKIKEQVKNEVDKLEVKPKYVVLINKNDSSSIGYVNMQRKNATSLGIEFESIEMDDSEEQYIETIERLNNDKSVTPVM